MTHSQVGQPALACPPNLRVHRGRHLYCLIIKLAKCSTVQGYAESHSSVAVQIIPAV